MELCVLLQIHSKFDVCNFVKMHSDLAFYSTLFRGLLFFRNKKNQNAVCSLCSLYIYMYIDWFYYSFYSALTIAT